MKILFFCFRTRKVEKREDFSRSERESFQKREKKLEKAFASSVTLGLIKFLKDH